MNKKNLILLYLLSVLLSFSCSGDKHPVELSLRIVMTSDVHGLLFPYDLTNDVPAEGSLSRVHSYVSYLRENEDHEVLLLDNGDILQGQPVVYYYNFEKSDQDHIIPAVMNYMGYNAATMGNHDIEAGHFVYDKVVDESAFPWLAANIVHAGTSTPYFEPYTIFDIKGFKVAVLGLITPMVPEWLPETLWEGMEFTEMVSEAERWMGILRAKEEPDLIIGLFHEGYGDVYKDEESGQTVYESGSAMVASLVEGFDIVMTGHDHRFWNKKISGPGSDSVLIIGPGSHARNVADVRVGIYFDPDKNEYIKEITSDIVSMSDFEPDQGFMDLFNAHFSEVKDYVSRKTGEFSATVSSRESLFGSSAFVDIVHELQLELTGADISFAAPLSYNAVIEKGDIMVRDMFNLYRFENYLYVMELTGNEIEGFLEYSYGNWFNQMKNKDDFLLRYRTDSSGDVMILDDGGRYSLAEPAFNFDSAAGIDYTVDVSRPAGERISIISMSNGNPFYSEKKYKVAINSYRGSGGGGHLEHGAGLPRSDFAERIFSTTERDLRHYLMQMIEEKGVIDPKPLNNWHIVPAEWHGEAQEREMKRLFND